MNSAPRQAPAPLTRQIGTMVSDETFGEVSAIATQKEWSIAKTARMLIVEGLRARGDSDATAQRKAA